MPGDEAWADDSGAWAVMEQCRCHETVRGDYVVSRCRFRWPGICCGRKVSAEKQRVIRELQTFQWTRYFCRCRKQFWKAKGLSGFANTDPGCRKILGAGPESPDERLAAVVCHGENAAKLDTMDVHSRVQQTLPMPRLCFRGAREQFEAARVKSWSEIRGSAAVLRSFGPGELNWIPVNARREADFFAGEHTSRMEWGMQVAMSRRIGSEGISA